MLGDGQSQSGMGMHALKHYAPATHHPSPSRYLCCTCYACIIDARLPTSLSLAWQLHRPPEHPHGMLGDGQSQPCMGMHALKRHAPATQHPWALGKGWCGPLYMPTQRVCDFERPRWCQRVAGVRAPRPGLAVRAANSHTRHQCATHT